MAFIDLMKEKAKQDVMTIILPESNDKRTLIAAAQVLKEKTADLIMIGKEEKIMDGAHWLEVDLTGLKVVDPDTDPKFDHYAETLFKLREKKGMTLEKAQEILKTDYITYGVMMVKEKDADGLVAGACHATETGSSDLKDSSGNRACIRFLHHGRSELRIRCKRHIPLR